MKTEEFNNLINQSVELIDEQKDNKTEIMTRIEEQNIKPIKIFIKKYLIIAAILISCSTTVFAGVHTYKLVELKNEENEVIGTVEVIETDDNHHLDSHVSREELFRYGDSLDCDEKWMDKSFMVIDSWAEYPYNVDVRLESKHVYDHSEVSDIDDSALLPMTLGDYTFASASFSYGVELPEEEDIKAQTDGYSGERFIVTEMESTAIDSISYGYKNKETDLMVWVRINIGDTSNEFTVFTSMLENYEVVKIGDIDVFLTESDYIGISYQATRTIKILGVNHFESTWFEKEKEFMISVEPNMFSKDRTEKEIDGEMVIVETYPENTKETILELTELIHQIINE